MSTNINDDLSIENLGTLKNIVKTTIIVDIDGETKECVDFADGTRIVRLNKVIEVTFNNSDINITGIYRCTSFEIGSYGVSFADFPTISATVCSYEGDEVMSWNGLIGIRTKTSFPRMIIFGVVTKDSKHKFVLQATAIGRWK